jgi:hypothetical protein
MFLFSMLIPNILHLKIYIAHVNMRRIDTSSSQENSACNLQLKGGVTPLQTRRHVLIRV